MLRDAGRRVARHRRGHVQHRSEHAIRQRVKARAEHRSGQQADYAVASGIMNVSLGCYRPQWEDGVTAMLVDLRRMGRRGFAVNFLTAVPEGSPPNMLYCADSAQWAGYCRSNLGCEIEVLESYGMREFTLLAKYS